MSIRNYYDWPGLTQVYLEDSFVLKITETSDRLEFEMELVLREGHPDYRAPSATEQYCFKSGRLVLSGARDITWHEKSNVISWDAAGDRDLGNIDVLCIDDDGWYRIQGDWGRVRLHADNVHLEL